MSKQVDKFIAAATAIGAVIRYDPRDSIFMLAPRGQVWVASGTVGVVHVVRTMYGDSVLSEGLADAWRDLRDGLRPATDDEMPDAIEAWDEYNEPD